MDPIAFTIPWFFGLEPVEIRWYGIMMALSMLLGAMISAWILRRYGRNGDLVWDGLFWIILLGVVGARFVYVATNLPLFFGEGLNPWMIFAVWQGGLSFHGGVIFGLVTTYIYFQNKEIPFIEVMDSFAPGVSLGIVLVRFGNFMNGDILSYKWDGPFAVNFPFDPYHQYGALDEVILRHPTEIYGMVVGLICLLVSVVLVHEAWERKRLPIGAAFFGFIFTYSLTRSVLEDPFRVGPLWKVVDPEVAGYGLFTYSQIASVGLIIIALWGFTQLRKWEKRRAEFAASGGKAKLTSSGKSRQQRRADERDAEKRQ